MDGIDPTSGMSVRHTKEKIGTKLTLMGGISCLTLLNGVPETVYEEARQCVLEGKANGRYVLGSACAVPRLTPFENIEAARAAAVDHGSYPCSGANTTTATTNQSMAGLTRKWHHNKNMGKTTYG